MLEDVVLLAVDCEKGEGPDLAKKYGVPAYPTYVMLNPDGQITASWLGYDGPESFAAKVRGGLDDPRPVAAKAAEFEGAPTAALAEALADHSAAQNDPVAAVGYLRKARELAPARAEAYGETILMTMFFGARQKAFSADETAAEAGPIQSAAVAAGDGDAAMIIGLQMASVPGARESRAAAAVVRTAAEVLASRPADARPPFATQIEIAGALIADADPAKALELKRGSLPAGWQEDAGQLNGFAWWCFENGVNLDEALTLARKSAELTDDDHERANVLDTVAEILHARGDVAGAVETMRRAVALHPERGYFQRQLERFEAAGE